MTEQKKTNWSHPAWVNLSCPRYYIVDTNGQIVGNADTAVYAGNVRVQSYGGDSYYPSPSIEV